MADLRRGLVPLTERYAMPHVLPYMSGNERETTVVMRAAAIIAGNRHTPHSDDRRVRLGHSARDLFRAINGTWPDGDNTGSVARRVLILPSLDSDRAVDAIDSLVAYCSTHQVAVNFYNMTQTLLRWGNGITDASLAVRNQIVRDFFSSHPKDNTDNSTTEKDES
jgi:hypothetical protein